MSSKQKSTDKKEKCTTSEEDEIFHIRENHEIIDLKNFWDIHQIMRSDYYLLDSLKENLETLIVIYPNKKFKNHNFIYAERNIPEENNEFLSKINSLATEYKKLDSTDFFNKLNATTNDDYSDVNEDVINEIVLTSEAQNVINLKRELSNLEIFSSTIVECIILSEKIEKLSSEILDFLYKVHSRNNEILSIVKTELHMDFVSRKRTIIFEYGLENHLDLDKIINYEIKCDCEKTLKYIGIKYKDAEITKNSFVIKKSDYRYTNNLLKKRLLDEYKETGKISKNDLELNKLKQMKVLNRILLYIAVISCGLQVLSIPKNYSDFYTTLIKFISSTQITWILIATVAIVLIIALISELFIFKNK